MPTESMITVAICCYGLYLKSVRHPREMKGLDQYLKACAKYIAKLYRQGRLSGIILCGGFTNRDWPDLSEAATNRDALLGYLREYEPSIDPAQLTILLEDVSRNTPQNIDETVKAMTFGRYSLREIKEAPSNFERIHLEADNGLWKSLSHDMVFVCDRYRGPKVGVIIRQLLDHQFNWGYDFTFSVKSFPRQDIHPNSSWPKQIAAALLYHFRPQRVIADLRHPAT